MDEKLKKQLQEEHEEEERQKQLEAALKEKESRKYRESVFVLGGEISIPKNQKKRRVDSDESS